MEFFTPKHRDDPNEKIAYLYHGVAAGGRVITKIIKADPEKKHLVSESVFEPGIPRGQGGNIGTLIIGGLETSLAEMQDIMAAKQEKKWVPRKSNSDIAEMCRYLLEARNDAIRYYRKNPSEIPPKKPKPILYLPTGCKMVQTAEPGLKILAQV